MCLFTEKQVALPTKAGAATVAVPATSAVPKPSSQPEKNGAKSVDENNQAAKKAKKGSISVSFRLHMDHKHACWIFRRKYVNKDV